ncbi:MAG: hypothetical protein FJW37_08865 [Acidobacteria bacterium]|nr:hypothetical protein [Acidobacteriota bacterium]
MLSRGPSLPAIALFRLGGWWVGNLERLRVALAVCALVAEVFWEPRVSPHFLLAIAAYASFAVLMALRGRTQSGALGLFGLFADTAFFLVLANRGTGILMWLPWVFYFYLLSRAVARHRPWEVLLVVGITIGFCLLAPAAHMAELRRAVALSGILAGAFAVHKRYLDQRAADLGLQAAAAADEAAASATQERQRIAADFHDGPLQSFISFHMRLEILRKLMERDLSAGLKELQSLQQLSQAQVRELRAFVRSSRPVEGDSANLAAALRRVTEEFEKESGIPVTFTGGESAFSTGHETGSDLLQMVREALHNVHKHARATRVAVALEKNGRTLDLSIDDNGVGFDFSGAYTLDELELLRLGPASVKRRARSLNAEMLLESWPGRGSGLKLKIPI